MQNSPAPIDINLHDTITAIGSTPHEHLYPIDKLDAHVRDIPHVAVSIFVFYENKLLIQQRAISKYHSGGLWANTVCSHPRWNETASKCAQRRLDEELGLQCQLVPFGTISYRAQVGELFENERVSCFYGHLSAPQSIEAVANCINPVEVSDLKWLTLAELDQCIQHTPDTFTEWFKIYMNQHRALLNSVLMDG